MNFWRDVLHLPSLKLILAVLLLFTVRLIVLTALEKRDPAHVVAYREVLPRDFFAMLVIGFGVVPAADFLDRQIMYYPELPRFVLEWPLAVRIIFYLVLA